MPEETPQQLGDLGAPIAPPAGVGAKDAYERRRAEKRASQTTSNGSSIPPILTGRLLRIVVWFAVLAIIGYGLYVVIRRNTPGAEDMSRAVPIEGREHIAVGAEHAPYNSNPPTSGPHYDTPAHPGFRDETIADEHVVHSLEHGLIWVAYHPRINESAREGLRDFADGWVVVTAREGNEQDIALVSWGRLDTFNLEGGALDEAVEQRIRDFINRYRGRGPERIPAGQHGGI